MAIADLDKYLIELGKKLGDSRIIGVNTSELTVHNQESYAFVIEDSKPQGTMFMGESVLANNTNETQTIHSDSFIKQITDSVTFSVTNGITAGVSITISGKIFGIGAESSMSFEVSTSTTNEQTSEESVSYIVPSQAVVVPPRKTYYVYSSLQRSQLNGTVRLRADLSNRFNFTYNGGSAPLTFNIYEYINRNQSSHPLPSGISLNHKDKSIHFEGVAEYIYGTGTKFYVTISDTPSSQGTQENKPFDAKTGLGTYELRLNGKKFGFNFNDLNDLKELMDPKDFENLKQLKNEIG